MTEATFKKTTSGWAGETKIEIGSKLHSGQEWTRFLVIDTRKNMLGNLYTHASVQCERGFQTIIDFGDFSKVIERDQSGARCTEKTVRTMHARNTGNLTALIEEAKAHYVGKQDAA